MIKCLNKLCAIDESKDRLQMKLIDKKLLISFILLVLFAELALPFTGEAASDPRFFGTYCGTYEYSYDIPVCIPILPICWRETRKMTFAITARAKYRESPNGDGLVSGASYVEGEGRRISGVFAGVVTERGRLQGSGSAQGIEHVTAAAILSEDGNTLTLRAYDHTFVLDKEACGNTAPTAVITTLEDTFPYGQLNSLRGEATDEEDSAFSNNRWLVWQSSRDASWRKYGHSARIDDLSPGDHTITFTVTDSGGLRASDRKDIHIENRAPSVKITAPSDKDESYEGQVIPLNGWATDTESGNLTNLDDALVWTYDDGRFIGTGASSSCQLPVGSHTITLTASDGATSESDSVSITVNPRPAGNTSPTVSILKPDQYAAIGNGPDDCIALEVNVAHDIEDGELTGDSLVWKAHMDGAAVARVLEPRGRRIIACEFPAGDTDTRHTITVTATDSEGASTTSAPRVIYVIPIVGGLE